MAVCPSAALGWDVRCPNLPAQGPFELSVLLPYPAPADPLPQLRLRVWSSGRRRAPGPNQLRQAPSTRMFPMCSQPRGRNPSSDLNKRVLLPFWDHLGVPPPHQQFFFCFFRTFFCFLHLLQALASTGPPRLALAAVPSLPTPEAVSLLVCPGGEPHFCLGCPPSKICTKPKY